MSRIHVQFFGANDQEYSGLRVVAAEISGDNTMKLTLEVEEGLDAAGARSTLTGVLLFEEVER